MPFGNCFFLPDKSKYLYNPTDNFFLSCRSYQINKAVFFTLKKCNRQPITSGSFTSFVTPSVGDIDIMIIDEVEAITGIRCEHYEVLQDEKDIQPNECKVFSSSIKEIDDYDDDFEPITDTNLGNLGGNPNTQ
jgi:hypothetical protein